MNRYRFSINANVSLVETGISPAADIFLTPLKFAA